MRVKTDEHVSPAAIQVLRLRGHDVATVVEEQLAGRPDADIAATATAENRLLITYDLGFSDIRAFPPGTHPGIVVIRVPGDRPSLILHVLGALLDAYELESLAGCTVVAHPGLVRIRRALTDRE